MFSVAAALCSFRRWGWEPVTSSACGPLIMHACILRAQSAIKQKEEFGVTRLGLARPRRAVRLALNSPSCSCLGPAFFSCLPTWAVFLLCRLG